MIALYFDTETSGVKSWRQPQFIPKLVQLAVVLEDMDNGRILAEINLIANQYPLDIIPDGAIAVHGITNEMAAEYGIDPKLIDLIFAELMKKTDILIAHNLDFDLDVIQDNMPLTWGALNDRAPRKFCTMDSNVMIVQAPLSDKQKQYYTSKGNKPPAPYKVPSLAETYQHYFGKLFDGAHNAMADIRACREIFLVMYAAGQTPKLPRKESI